MVDDTGVRSVHRLCVLALLIGVTGSNGRTTVKEMCAAILRAASRDGFGEESVLATRGNLNNDIGMPLTLPELRDFHRAAVIEMGMNHPGEIGYLSALAQPTVALRTTPSAHLEGMGTSTKSRREGRAIYEGRRAACGDQRRRSARRHWRSLNAGPPIGHSASTIRRTVPREIHAASARG